MSAKILVVEDDLNMQELIVELLEDQGYFVKGAASNVEALTLATKYPFDLVVTDVRLPGPDGIDGFILLKRKFPNLRCIVITGWANDVARKKAVSIQVDDYLEKPPQLQVLLDSVERVLSSSKLFRYYKNLAKELPSIFKTALNFFQRNSASDVERLRQDAFSQLFLAIRASLDKATANSIYYQLEQSDSLYKVYLEEETKGRAEHLIGIYRSILGSLAKFEKEPDNQASVVTRIPGPKFEVLFQAVRSYSVKPDEFQLAPTLRTIDRRELIGSPDLIRLRERMWGPFPSQP